MRYRSDLYNIITSALEKTGDYQNAYNYSKAQKVWQDSMAQSSRSAKILELESKYQSKQKELENDFLLQQQSKKDQIIKQQSYLNLGALLTLILGSLLAFALYRIFRRTKEYNINLERKVNEKTKDLIKSNNELAASNEELERFAYIASHDLKEPLRNIMGFTGLLKKEIATTENSKTNMYMDIIENNSDRMYRLIRDTLEFSKISHEGSILEKVDLNETINDISQSLADTLSKNNAEIICEEKLPLLLSNKTKIFLLFKNLIENGLKYNNSQKPTINIEYFEQADQHKFRISDNGIGIDTKYSEQIFDMFYRLHNKSKWDGAGLGLSVCKKIITQMGGEIWVEGRDEIGSNFYFTIPKKMST